MTKVRGGVGSFLLLIPACTEVTELRLEIALTPQTVAILAREVDRPCTCTNGEWLAVGECGTSSDGVACTCDPPPAECIDRIAVERDGEVGDDSTSLLGGRTAVAFGDSLLPATLIVEGCGSDARIPLEIDASSPQPHIDGIDDDGSRIIVTWSSAPQAESALISVGGAICHVAGGDAHELPFSSRNLSDPVSLSIHAFAAPRAFTTSLGEARVWTGGLATTTIEPVD